MNGSSFILVFLSLRLKVPTKRQSFSLLNKIRVLEIADSTGYSTYAQSLRFSSMSKVETSSFFASVFNMFAIWVPIKSKGHQFTKKSAYH